MKGRIFSAATPFLLAIGAVTLANATEIKVPGTVIEVSFTTPPGPKLEAAAPAWIKNAAHAVSGYYGRFPVRRVSLEIETTGGQGAGGGYTSGWSGVTIQLSAGRDSTAADLAKDWILTHEMVHTALPNLAERHHWLEEGLATYVEPVARAQAGFLTPETVWFDFMANMDQGEPKAGDKGLDRTPTWGRTYWGGALFCLLADIQFRERTGNKKGLQDAMRGVLSAGGNIESAWKIERVLETADAAAGAPVLRKLYEQMKDKPVHVDLPALWKRLGVVRRGSTVSFDDESPLAAVRRAITEAR